MSRDEENVVTAMPDTIIAQENSMQLSKVEDVLSENIFPHTRTITINKAVADYLQKSTLTSQPNECCALLFTHSVGHTLAISGAACLPNAYGSQSRFGIRRKDFTKAVQKTGLTFCGVYHSHPDSLDLSPTDKQGIKNSHFPWLIGLLKRELDGRVSLGLRVYINRGNRVIVLNHTIGG